MEMGPAPPSHLGGSLWEKDQLATEDATEDTRPAPTIAI